MLIAFLIMLGVNLIVIVAFVTVVAGRRRAVCVNPAIDNNGSSLPWRVPMMTWRHPLRMSGRIFVDATALLIAVGIRVCAR